MMDLLERVRFNIEWAQRNTTDAPDADAVIDRMTPLELLKAISEALSEFTLALSKNQ